jgi:hypothetical protein
VPAPAGLTDQFTVGFTAFTTVAMKYAGEPALKVAAVGVMLIDTGGRSWTSAEPDSVGSATLVAVTTTLVAESTEDGAVYNPVPSMLPSPGWMDHVTVGSVPGDMAI